MLNLRTTDVYERRRKRYAKNHPRELEAVLNNLNIYFDALLAGVMPLQNTSGFTHNEGHGVGAIDQRRGGRNLAQTRLYVYPELETEILHVLTLGDKQSQKNDITICHEIVAELREERNWTLAFLSWQFDRLFTD